MALHCAENVQPEASHSYPGAGTEGPVAMGASHGTMGAVRGTTEEQAKRRVHTQVHYAAVRVRQRGTGWRRAIAFSAAAVLCCAAVLHLGTGAVEGGGRVSMGEAGYDKGGQLSGKALADVKQMYAHNPMLVKEFAQLTGSSGQRLLTQIQGPPKKKAKEPEKLKFKQPSLHTLDKYMQQLKSSMEEQVHYGADESSSGERMPPWQALGTVEVNKRTALMLVNDLSEDWDKNTNYTKTPWEFCAGRNLSPRQIRECTGHLIRAAGVHSHRDLNMNAKIYDRFCTGDGHQFIDKYGSPIFLPTNNRDMCSKVRVVCARLCVVCASCACACVSYAFACAREGRRRGRRRSMDVREAMLPETRTLILLGCVAGGDSAHQRGHSAQATGDHVQNPP